MDRNIMGNNWSNVWSLPNENDEVQKRSSYDTRLCVDPFCAIGKKASEDFEVSAKKI